MRRCAWLCGVVAGVALLPGCVERRYVVTADPPGALVQENGRPLGAAPADNGFVYYGNHHFTLIRDDHETLQVDECIQAPWWQYPPFDFFADLAPWTIHDVRRFHYQLQPLQKPNAEEVGQRAQQLRDKGQQLTPLTPAGQ